MSILKRKVRLFPLDETYDKTFNVKIEDSTTAQEEEKTFVTRPVKVNIGSKPSPKHTNEDALSDTKTESGSSCSQGTKIVRNYGKALCSFAFSEEGAPFLKDIIEKRFHNDVDMKAFQDFIRGRKEHTTSILTLRALLLVDKNDGEDIKAFKRIFREMSVIFLKFYAVNWIFNGKIKHKIDHLRCRPKMLRRIRNPEFFTNLKS